MNEKTKKQRRFRYETKYKPAYTALMKFYSFTLESIENEEWMDVTGYEGLYQVSTYGRVKSFCRRKEKIIKPALSSGGYLYINLSRIGRAFIHTLVGNAFIPNPDNKPQINHRDGCKLNNCVDNLEWMTKLENEQHSWLVGLRKTGELHQNAKLTDTQVVYIRENPNRLNGKELAKKFGVSAGTISQIQTGKKRKDNGGRLRKSKTPPSLPADVKEMIRAEYQKGVRGCGTPALAKKYGTSSETVWHVVNKK